MNKIPRLIPITQTALITVSALCFAFSVTVPIIKAEITAKINAPIIGGNPGIIVADRYRAIPMPPSTACETAPARLPIRLTVITDPSIPKSTEDKIPANNALRKKGKLAFVKASKNSGIIFSF
jgi:hypothetical protein